MSWQAYIDTSLVGSGKITSGAILGHDGSVWAYSPTLPITSEETTALVAGFSNPAPLYTLGFRLGGNKFFVVRADDREIVGKMGAIGVCCAKSKQAIIIGLHDENTVMGEAMKVVGGLADYLVSVNY